MAFLPIPAYHISLNQHIVISTIGRPKMEQTIYNLNEKHNLLTAREAAEYLRVSLSTLNRMERRGRLQPLRTPGGHRRYTLEMLNECLTLEVKTE
ncbi:MAG: helix-turn-helix domain-containing protein [Anaerolineales bacterium]|nr:helix-turn-helix domain-containing protein [Anaerolineales bacterium]